MGQQKSQKGNTKISRKTTKKTPTAYQNGAAAELLRGKFIVINAYIKTKGRF